MAVLVCLEELLIGPTIADALKFIDGHLELAQQVRERLAKIAPWEFTVVSLDPRHAIIQAQTAPANMVTGDIRGAAEPVFHVSKIIVDAYLVAIQVLIVGQ